MNLKKIRIDLKLQLFFLVLFLLCLQSCNLIDSLSIPKNNLSIFKSDTFLIVVPHPDDEILAFGGLIYDAVKYKKTVKIIIATNGDAYDEASFLWKNGCPNGMPDCNGEVLTKEEKEEFGKIRIEESKQALKVLGFNSSNLHFLGYPDGYIEKMFFDTNRKIIGNTSRKVSYTDKEFTGNNFKSDLKSIFAQYPTANILTTHELDNHLDHKFLFKFIHLIKKELSAKDYKYNLYYSIIHEPEEGYNGNWPEPSVPLKNHGDFTLEREKRYNPTIELKPPKTLKEQPIKYYFDNILWDETLQIPLLRSAIDCFNTQEGSVSTNGNSIEKKYLFWLDRNGYLISFVKKNHLIWKID